MLAAEGRSVEFTPVPPAPAALGAPPPKATPGAAPAARTSAPSPWAKEAKGIDAAALPSANAPAGEAAGRSVQSGQAKRPTTKAWTPARKGLAAVAGAFMPAILVLMLLKPKTVVQYVPVPMSAAPAPPASASGAASIAPSVAVSAIPSAAPTTQPSTQPTTSATGQKPRPRATSDDPYDAAPVPTATVKSAPTVEPTAQPAVKPTAEPDPFIDRRPQ